jgi:hypothetical protein
MNLNETRVLCVEYNDVCVQKKTLSSIDSIAKEVYSIMNIKNRNFIYKSIAKLTMSLLNRTTVQQVSFPLVDSWSDVIL